MKLLVKLSAITVAIKTFQKKFAVSPSFKKLALPDPKRNSGKSPS